MSSQKNIPPAEIVELLGTEEWIQTDVGSASQQNHLSENWAIQERPFANLLYWMKLQGWFERNDHPLLVGAKYQVCVIENGKLLLEEEIKEKYYYLLDNPRDWPNYHRRQKAELWIVSKRLDSPDDKYSYFKPIDKTELWEEHVKFWPEALKASRYLSSIQEKLPLTCSFKSKSPGQHAHGCKNQEIKHILLTRKVDSKWLDSLPEEPEFPVAASHGDLILKNMVYSKADKLPRLIDWETVSNQDVSTDIGHYLSWGLNFVEPNDYQEKFAFANQEVADELNISVEKWRTKLLWSALREACFWSARKESVESGRTAFPDIVKSLQKIF